MIITIVTDGPYGERAYATIKEEFKTEFIVLEPPEGMFAEDVKIPSEELEKIKSSDLVITYTLHPDLTLDLVDAIYSQVDWIIVGAWKGEGFKNQLLRYGNVTCPENMCDLTENGTPTFDEFVSKFGRPLVKINCQGNKVVDIEVDRCSPCGSTQFVADALIGEETENLPIKAGLKIQHYPCRAPKMRLFSDDECKKEMAANFHKDAFEEALTEEKSAKE
ncbi:MAG: DUF166 domain-containing protein [Methanobacteriaceae archaeon]|nr:DUF166 domain-containing protein [Methanobacteriaceae archaeon]